MFLKTVILCSFLLLANNKVEAQPVINYNKALNWTSIRQHILGQLIVKSGDTVLSWYSAQLTLISGHTGKGNKYSDAVLLEYNVTTTDRNIPSISYVPPAGLETGSTFVEIPESNYLVDSMYYESSTGPSITKKITLRLSTSDAVNFFSAVTSGFKAKIGRLWICVPSDARLDVLEFILAAYGPIEKVPSRSKKR